MFFVSFEILYCQRLRKFCSSKGAYCKGNGFSPYFSTTANLYVDIPITLLIRCILAVVAPVTMKLYCAKLSLLCVLSFDVSKTSPSP